MNKANKSNLHNVAAIWPSTGNQVRNMNVQIAKLCLLVKFWLLSAICGLAIWDQKTLQQRQQSQSLGRYTWSLSHRYSGLIPSLSRAYAEPIPSLFRAAFATKQIENETLFRGYSESVPSLVLNLFQALL